MSNSQGPKSIKLPRSRIGYKTLWHPSVKPAPMGQPHREPLDFWSPWKPSLATCHSPWVGATSAQVDGNFSKHSVWLTLHGSSGFESHFNLWRSELSDLPQTHIWADPKLESFEENLSPFAAIMLKMLARMCTAPLGKRKLLCECFWTLPESFDISA